MPRIAITKGDERTPERFWNRAVCEDHELTDDLKAEGWVQTKSRKHLTKEQVAYLESRKE